jgi:hypothetical protein
MATVYKTLLNSDIVSTRTLLHEAIPITGSIVSGTYIEGSAADQVEVNVKNYAHGMFQSVYDYPYLSSSANHIFDLSVGYSSKSALSGSTAVQNSKKINIYNQMAQVLMGYDHTGSIQQFDEDGDLIAGGTKLNECYFFNFSRLLAKDEVKKGSFMLDLGMTTDYTAPFTEVVRVHDISASNDFRSNSPAGEYGILEAINHIGTPMPAALQNKKVGLIFYQAGIAVLSGSVFNSITHGGVLTTGAAKSVIMTQNYNDQQSIAAFTGSAISASCDGVRNRIYNLQFNNTTELNSTIYFCRINHNDYNYSSNQTYLSGSKIRVKNTRSDSPSSYITTVGLYSADNELLAVAKLSEALKKDPTTELTLRVRLDY